MTEKKPRDPAELTAERFITKLRRRAATEHSRHDAARIDARMKADARFAERENAWRCNMLARVTESERGPAVDMARALRLTIDAPPDQDPPCITLAASPTFATHEQRVTVVLPGTATSAESTKAVVDAIDDDTPSRPVLDEYAADLELPAGAKPYTPSAVAQAALGRRR